MAYVSGPSFQTPAQNAADPTDPTATTGAAPDWFAQNRPQRATQTAPAGVDPAVYQNYQQNYWAPDRDQVLGDPSRMQPAGQQQLPTGGSVTSPNFGGGWSDPWAQQGGASALQAALRAGIPLDQAPEWIKAHYPGLADSGAYYPQIGSSGKPGIAFSNYYTATTPGGAIDLISRPSGGGSGGGAQQTLGGFGSLAQGWNGSFSAPTADQAAQTPGYEFTRDQGLHAIDAGAAARGNLLTGGNVKARANYVAGLASQTYGSTYDRALGEYMNAYSIFRNNSSDLFNRTTTLANFGMANPAS